MSDDRWDVAKVRDFGAMLLSDRNASVALVSHLLAPGDFGGNLGSLFTRRDFTELSPFEKAGVVDELRDALDQQLGVVFQSYVKLAREDAEKRQGAAK